MCCQMVGDLQVKICGLERDILAQHAVCRDADIGDNSEIICMLVISREDLTGLKIVEIIIIKKKSWLLTAKRRKRIQRLSMLMLCETLLYKELEGYL